MKIRSATYIVAFGLAGMVAACGPSQAELDARATETAESAQATQIAQVPTSSPTATWTPTASPTPTFTPTQVPTATDTPTPISTPFLPMEEFSIFMYGVSIYIDIPADWEGQLNPQPTYTQILFSGERAAVEIWISEFGGDWTFQEYIESDIQFQAQQEPEFELLKQETLVNAQGLPLEIITTSQNPGALVIKRRLYYLHEDEIAFMISYLVLRDEFEKFEPIIEYSFSTFDVGD